VTQCSYNAAVEGDPERARACYSHHCRWTFERRDSSGGESYSRAMESPGGDGRHRALGIPRSTATEFSGWILEASKRQGLSPELLASVVFIESSFRKNVTSDMGAIGPAQVKPYWSPFCGSANLSDPAENIYCGAQILAHYRDLCGDEQCALSAYNVGMKNQRDDAYYQELGLRYAKSIDRHVSRLSKTFL
jgi:hypothetical protein